MNNFFQKLYNQKPIEQCATKVVHTNEHCPESAEHRINDSDDYLCERCYNNYLERKQIKITKL